MPTTARQRPVEPTERDVSVLQHIADFRMTTFAALHTVFFDGQSADAVKSMLRRLYGDRSGNALIASDRLDSNRVYYRLTRRACGLIGTSPDLARPLGPRARAHRYALLWFACQGRCGERSLFNPRDFLDQFPIENERLPEQGFYLEQDGEEVRIGYILIDHGAHLRRVLRKTADVLTRFVTHGWFDDFIRSGLFDLTLLTFSDGRCTELETSLTTSVPPQLQTALRRLGTFDDEFPVRMRVMLVPGLFSLIPGRK